MLSWFLLTVPYTYYALSLALTCHAFPCLTLLTQLLPCFELHKCLRLSWPLFGKYLKTILFDLWLSLAEMRLVACCDWLRVWLRSGCALFERLQHNQLMRCFDWLKTGLSKQHRESDRKTSLFRSAGFRQTIPVFCSGLHKAEDHCNHCHRWQRHQLKFNFELK